MSAAVSFAAYSPAYENIANRMSRLRHHKPSQSLTQIRPNSARKLDINVFTIEASEHSAYQPRRRLSPTALAFPEELRGEKVSGRVAKNTGLKKYNQRQLREIGDGRTGVNLKT